MAELTRPDGARIHYEVQGESGPTVVLASYWSWYPEIYTELLSDLATDHRVVTYHLRGSGSSSPQGPFDMQTDIGDLEGLLESLDGAAVLLGTADGANRAARLAARRRELVGAVACFGAAPLSRALFKGEEGMATSDTVVNAFVEMLETNYRGGMRVFMEATNPQASEEELRERVNQRQEFFPAKAALSRFKEWISDDPLEDSRTLAGRLWVFAASGVAGPWLPPGDVVERLTRAALPEANIVTVEPGPISAPRETAEAVRRITAPLHPGAAAKQK